MASGYCQVSGEFCESLDVHHVIPREYGGEYGPTVCLSPTVHQTLHRVAFDNVKLDAFAHRYANSDLVYRLANFLRYCKENVKKTQSNHIVVNLTERELKVLTEQAARLNISPSKLVAKIVRKVLGTGD